MWPQHEHCGRSRKLLTASYLEGRSRELICVENTLPYHHPVLAALMNHRSLTGAGSYPLGFPHGQENLRASVLSSGRIQEPERGGATHAGVLTLRFPHQTIPCSSAVEETLKDGQKPGLLPRWNSLHVEKNGQRGRQCASYQTIRTNDIHFLVIYTTYAFK